MSVNGTSTLELSDGGRQRPATTAPPGKTSDFSSPDWIGGRVIAVNIVCLVVSGIVLGLRLYTRMHIMRQPGLDDVFIVLAWLFFFVMAIILCIQATHYGLGSHLWNVELSKYSPYFLKLDVIGSLFFFISNMFIKCSILYLLVRLSDTRSKFLRGYLYTLLGFSVVYNVAAVFAIIFNCNPVEALWDLEAMETAKCAYRPRTYVIAGYINVVTDIMVFLSPLLLFGRLKLPLRQKVALLALLMTGGLACVFSVARLTSIVHGEQIGDDTRYLVNSICWSVAEIGSGCTCACVACLKPFVVRYFSWFAPPLMASKSISSSRGGGGHVPSSYVLGSLTTQIREPLKLRPDKGPNGINTSTITSQKRDRHSPYHLSKIPNDAPHNGSEGELILGETIGRGRIVVTVTSDFAVVEEDAREEPSSRGWRRK